MRWSLSLFIFTFLSSPLFGQIEIRVNKVANDSFEISFPADMQLEMGKRYEFVYRTNITKKDKLYENIAEGLLYDGKRISFKFNYHEYEFTVSKKVNKDMSKQLASRMMYIKGTKYLVLLDNKLITRSKSNKINKSTKVSIELFSDTENVNDMEVGKPIGIYWMQNPTVRRTIWLMKDNKAYFDLSKDPAFLKGRTTDEYNHIIIELPQVYLYLSPLLAPTFQERIYIMSWED